MSPVILVHVVLVYAGSSPSSTALEARETHFYHEVLPCFYLMSFS